MKMGNGENPTIKNFIPRGNTSLQRPGHKWQDNIRNNLKEISINMRHWIDSAQDRDYWKSLANVAFNLRALKAKELINILLTTIFRM